MQFSTKKMGVIFFLKKCQTGGVRGEFGKRPDFFRIFICATFPKRHQTCRAVDPPGHPVWVVLSVGLLLQMQRMSVARWSQLLVVLLCLPSGGWNWLTPSVSSGLHSLPSGGWLTQSVSSLHRKVRQHILCWLHCLFKNTVTKYILLIHYITLHYITFGLVVYLCVTARCNLLIAVVSAKFSKCQKHKLRITLRSVKLHPGYLTVNVSLDPLKW